MAMAAQIVILNHFWGEMRRYSVRRDVLLRPLQEMKMGATM
jgi:hypothetical protein